MIQHDGELITPKVREPPILADDRRQATSDGREQLVAPRMSQTVVDRSKSVEIQHEDRERVALQLVARTSRFETILEGPPATR